jgi:hypothetical protein
MRLPSLNTCTDSVTASAEYGAPGVIRDSTAARATSTICFSSAAWGCPGRVTMTRCSCPAMGAANASAATVIVSVCFMSCAPDFGFVSVLPNFRLAVCNLSALLSRRCCS